MLTALANLFAPSGAGDRFGLVLHPPAFAAAFGHAPFPQDDDQQTLRQLFFESLLDGAERVMAAHAPCGTIGPWQILTRSERPVLDTPFLHGHGFGESGFEIVLEARYRYRFEFARAMPSGRMGARVRNEAVPADGAIRLHAVLAPGPVRDRLAFALLVERDRTIRFPTPTSGFVEATVRATDRALQHRLPQLRGCSLRPI